jgi:hypothetical protein
MDPASTQAVAKAAEATAKTAGQVAELVHDTGGYLSRVFGNVPEDIVGVCGGDWLHERRIRNRERLRRRTEQVLQERDVQEVIELSPNVAVSLIAGAQEEGREELMELWARLLANAMDPNLNSVRRSFIDGVKKMDPLDAVVLRYIHQSKINSVRSTGAPEPLSNLSAGTEDVSSAIGCRNDEVEVSIRHLEDLSFIEERTFTERQGPNEFSEHLSWRVNAIGREFLLACYPEVKTE